MTDSQNKLSIIKLTHIATEKTSKYQSLIFCFVREVVKIFIVFDSTYKIQHLMYFRLYYTLKD